MHTITSPMDARSNEAAMIRGRGGLVLDNEDRLISQCLANPARPGIRF